MMGLFDCVDDTVLVKKALLSVSFIPCSFRHAGLPSLNPPSLSLLPSLPPSLPLLPPFPSPLLSFTRRYVTLLRSCVTTCMAAGCCYICSVLATDDTSVRSLSVFSLLVTTTSTGTDHIRKITEQRVKGSPVEMFVTRIKIFEGVTTL